MKQVTHLLRERDKYGFSSLETLAQIINGGASRGASDVNDFRRRNSRFMYSLNLFWCISLLEGFGSRLDESSREEEEVNVDFCRPDSNVKETYD